MKTWFMCKVKYAKEDEKGMLKNVTEAYLIDAVSFTEAEARIYEEMGSVIRGEFQVTNISKTNIVDVFHYDDSDIWHKCKVTYMVTDEDSGKEKKITQHFVLTAHDVRQAYERIYESLNNMLVSFRVPDIVESNIVEIFPYIPEEEKEQKIPDNLKPLNPASGAGNGNVYEAPEADDEEGMDDAPYAATSEEEDFAEEEVQEDEDTLKDE